MNIAMLLDLAASAHPEREALRTSDHRLTYGELHQAALAGAEKLQDLSVERVAFLAPNGVAFTTALFASAYAGIPFAPLNYRLGHEQLGRQMRRLCNSLVIAETDARVPVEVSGGHQMSREAWLEVAMSAPIDHARDWPSDGDAIAVLLYTSGTSSEPKAAVLRHRHLTSYVLGTVELSGAEPDESALVSLPPYHIAGVANTLTSVFAGRRIVYLSDFSPEAWLATVQAEGITHALLVPTMLARIVEFVGDVSLEGAQSLRSIAYGGARLSRPILERALTLFGNTDFVNAYGLTETSSTIAVLGPEDHRAAVSSTDPHVRARLGSAGRVVPGLELEIRDESGAALPPNENGEIWVRGGQISGEYLDQSSGLDGGNWFPTRDGGRLDEDGYLFVEGRIDDTIIRGGENIAPAEIEDVLSLHPGVADSVVVGLADDEWGERIAAVVVARSGYDLSVDEILAWTRGKLRSSRTPDVVLVRDALPRTDSGKVIRRQVLHDLITTLAQ